MLSIGAMAAGQDMYYLRLATEDYYLDGGEPPGRWWGRGAEHLGLAGLVEAVAFSAIFRGFGLDGTKLIQNAGRSNHQPGSDHTFSLTKEGDILWFFGNEAQRKHVEEAHRLGVVAGVSYLQDEAAFSRRGKGGSRLETVGLVVALFEHGSSRAGDPHLHTHALVMNVGVRPDGSTGTVLSRPFYQHKMAAGAVYRATVAAELQRRLGVQIERTEKSYRILGVPSELVRHFSKRRVAILNRLEERGVYTAKAAAVAALDTRNGKERPAPREELFARWRQEAAALGYSTIPALAEPRQPMIVPPAVELRSHIELAIVSHADTSGTLARGQLVRRVAQETLGRGFDGNEIRTAVSDQIRRSDRLFRIAQVAQVYGFKKAFRVDRQAFKLARNLITERVHGVSDLKVRGVLRRHAKRRTVAAESVSHHTRQIIRAFKKQKTQALSSKAVKRLSHRVLSPSEQQLVRQATQRRLGGLRLISAPRGLGRFHILRATREALEKGGYRVFMTSATRAGVGKLEAFAGAESLTFKSLEYRLRPSLSFRTKHAAKQIIRAIRGKRTFGLKPFQIDGSTAIVVNGGRYLNTRRFKLFARAVKAGGGMMIVIGESTSLKKPPRGIFEHLLHRTLGMAPDRRGSRLSRPSSRNVGSISRERHASQSICERRLLADWFASRERHAGKAVIVCEQRTEAARLNSACQADRVRVGELRGPCVTQGSAKFFEGDRVHFAEAARSFGISGGETGVIVRLKPAKQTVVIRLDGGGHLAVPLNACPQLHHGYAIPVGVRHQQPLSEVFSLGEANRAFFADTVGPNEIPNLRTYLTDTTQEHDRKQTAGINEAATGRRQELRL